METPKIQVFKKRRELLSTVNKRKMSLRKYIDVKFNQNECPPECSLEISQITKCVFLGSLYLKPVPHLFDSPMLLTELGKTFMGNINNTTTNDENQSAKFVNNENSAPKIVPPAEETISSAVDDSVKSEIEKVVNETIETREKEPSALEESNQVPFEPSCPDVEEPPHLTPLEALEIQPMVIEPELPEGLRKTPSPSNTPEDDIKKCLDLASGTLDLSVYNKDSLEKALQEKGSPSEEALTKSPHQVFLKHEAAPELLLADTDDDTIDQLMFNIMDIKIEPNVYDREYYEVPQFMDNFHAFPNPYSANSVLQTNENRPKEKKQIRRIPQCKICSQIFPSFLRLKRHKLEHDGEKPYLCLECGDNHTSLDQLLAHLRKHKGKRPYVCKKCNKSFKTPKALEAHQPVHVLRKVIVPKRVFQCEICSKEFRKLCDLERHTRVHTGEKPSVCNICNRRFQQAHNLNKHLLIHTQEKPFQCDICNKRFGRNDVLNRHILTHSVKKPNHCEICNKSFIRISQLQAHIEKHHSKEEEAS